LGGAVVAGPNGSHFLKTGLIFNIYIGLTLVLRIKKKRAVGKAVRRHCGGKSKAVSGRAYVAWVGRVGRFCSSAASPLDIAYM
jgi:hypothetical protein